jgi:hypothetical protein
LTRAEARQETRAVAVVSSIPQLTNRRYINVATMTDQERVDELCTVAIGGMTEEIASELYGFLDHENDTVMRKAFGAFEYSPRNETERQRIQYDRVVEEASRVLREDPGPDTEFELRIYDTLSFIIDEHAPQTVGSLDRQDREWALELLDHDIYVIRELGCKIIAEIGDQTDLDRLNDLAAADESEDVRNAAEAAIDKIQDR